jgi:Mrp family chromosome partitioning ATPase
MFVPLEPQFSVDPWSSAAIERCDAAGHFPPGTHFSAVAASTRSFSNGVQFVTSSSSADESVVVRGGLPVTQCDAALSRTANALTSTENGGWPGEPVSGVHLEATRQDAPQAPLPGPHRQRVTRKSALAEFPRNVDPAQIAATAGTVAHSAAPPVIASTAESGLESPPSRLATFRTYSKTTRSIPLPPAVPWDRGLVESSRRADWLWPKIVDELIGRQWDTISQLGRTALGNSRDETRRVLVTGVQRGEGRTTIALALARWSAMSGRHTLLIDADLRRPGVAAALHVATAGDWRQSPLPFGIESRLLTCRSLPLSLLPLGATPDEKSEAALIEQLLVLLAVAEQEFDCSILDVGPVDELCQQIATVTRLASSAVVVSSQGAKASPLVTSACNTLWQRGRPAIAIADNLHR